MDFTAGGITAVGYSHPQVVEAVIDQAKTSLEQGDISIAAADLRNDLAEEVKSWLPSSLSNGKVAFGHSGSDIIERAIRISRFATNRPMIISFFEAHHGASPGALSASPTLREMGSETISRFFQLPGFLHMPFPDSYRPWFGTGPDAGEASLAFLERLLSSVISPSLIAGILAEPILSYGGNIVPPDGYFQGLKDICQRYKIPLIADEVLTGIGKTGRMFAMEHWNTWPNVLCLGKALSGGVPLSLLIAEGEIANNWHSEDHVGMSKDGHLLGCAMALSILRVVRKEKLVEMAEKMGNYMTGRLLDMKEDLDLPGEIRGLGLMTGFDLVQNEANRKPATDLAERVVEIAMKKRLIIGQVGAKRNVIRFMPPLSVNETEIDTAISITEDAFKDLK